MPSLPSRAGVSSMPLSEVDARVRVPLGDLVRLALSTKERPALAERGGLPMPNLPTADVAGPTFYTVSGIDKWGRLSDRSAPMKLGWLPGTALDVTVLDKVVVATASAYGSCRITGQAHLRLPAAIRRAAHIESGDRLLIAACDEGNILVVYPMPILDAMVLAFHQHKDDGVVQ